MGVTGLLTLLKSIQQPCNLSSFKGQVLGVDAYCWLHRGAVASALELALEKPTRKHVDFAMHRVRMLLHFGITPYIVLDGGHLPSKARTEDGRKSRRDASKKAGLELLRLGKTSQAYKELQKAIDVTPEMAKDFVEELKTLNIKFVVAPYEADAQLAYLERKGIIQGIISEDSDLLLFGARCLLTKLDQYGECISIRSKDFANCREVDLNDWTMEKFRMMAILSGCDYLKGIHKMGLKTAYRLVRKYKTIERVLRGAQVEGKLHVPPDYLEQFNQAEKTFLYQWVFCPETKSLVHANEPPIPSLLNGVTYIGEDLPIDVARKIAHGDIDPISKRPLNTTSTKLYKRPLSHSKGKLRVAEDSSINQGKKPLDAFLKPKRVPLAELDPNSLTPSLSQSHLLRRPTTWVAESAPSRRNSNSEESVGTITGVAMTGSQHVPSTANPRKRLRLCAEDLMNLSDSNAIVQGPQRSKFFTDTGGKESPLIDRALRMKQKRSRRDIDIFSDDSIEDAMALLSSTEGLSTAPYSVGTEELQASGDPTTYHRSRQDPLSLGAKSPRSRGLNTASKSPCSGQAVLLENALVAEPSSPLISNTPIGKGIMIPKDLFCGQSQALKKAQKHKSNHTGKSISTPTRYSRWPTKGSLAGTARDVYEDPQTDQNVVSVSAKPSACSQSFEKSSRLNRQAKHDHSIVNSLVGIKGSEDLFVVPDSESDSDDVSVLAETPQARILASSPFLEHQGSQEKDGTPATPYSLEKRSELKKYEEVLDPPQLNLNRFAYKG